MPVTKSGGGGGEGSAGIADEGGGYDFASWLERNGVSRADALDLGHLDPRDLAVVSGNRTLKRMCVESTA